MNNCRGRGIAAFLIILLVITCVVKTTSGDVGGDEKQKPNAAERAIGFLDPLSRWEKVKSWAKVTWINYGPPSERTQKPQPDAGGAVKEAFSESYETAEHAAKVAGDAVHKAAEKMSAVGYSSPTNSHFLDIQYDHVDDFHGSICNTTLGTGTLGIDDDFMA